MKSGLGPSEREQIYSVAAVVLVLVLVVRMGYEQPACLEACGKTQPGSIRFERRSPSRPAGKKDAEMLNACQWWLMLPPNAGECWVPMLARALELVDSIMAGEWQDGFMAAPSAPQTSTSTRGPRAGKSPNCA